MTWMQPIYKSQELTFFSGEVMGLHVYQINYNNGSNVITFGIFDINYIVHRFTISWNV